MPSIAVTETQGDIRLVVDGDPSQHHPWNIILSPESAYRLGTDLAARALRKTSGKSTVGVTTTTGERSKVQHTPTSSVDAAPPAISPQTKSNQDLLGDTF